MALIGLEDEATEVSLAHRSLGDEYIQLISEVINDLPLVTKVDLRDNRLTDEAIQLIVSAIAGRTHAGIKVLDLSENKLDSVSAESLCDYLISPNCTLHELLLSKADMDDNETTIFMRAMEVNRSVTFLDFSNNEIGGSHEKVQNASVVTGGRAIAQALNLNTTLLKIDLSWNRLGSKSGVLLGHALGGNHSLRSLNLAYNAISDQGAKAIGSALMTNQGLAHLDLSFNDISARAVLVIAQALETNGTLADLQLNGNSICAEGGRAIIRSMNYWTIPRRLGMDSCSLENTMGDKTFFDPLHATGKYKLDCTDPYQYAVAYELLRLASIRPGCEVHSLVFRKSPHDRAGAHHTLQRSNGTVDMMGSRRNQQQQGSDRFASRCRSAQMDAEEWKAQLSQLWVVDRKTGIAFYPPQRGTLELSVTHTPLPATELSLLNSAGLDHLRSLMVAQPAMRMNFLRLTAKDLWMLAGQVQDIIECCSKAGAPLTSSQVIELMADVIPQIFDTDSLQGLMEMNLDQKQQRALQGKVGHTFAAFTNTVCGHFQLDLSQDLDRTAAMRLAERSNWETKSLKVLSGWPPDLGATGQRGRWSNFRNEIYRGKSVRKGLTDAFFRHGLRDKMPGVLEFDFVSTSRPPQSTQPMSDACFARFLHDCGLTHLRRRESASKLANLTAQLIKGSPMHSMDDSGSGGGQGSAAAAAAAAKLKKKKGGRSLLAEASLLTPFVPRLPSGVKSLEEALEVASIDHKAWASQHLPLLWNELLNADCALVTAAGVGGVAQATVYNHVVQVRICSRSRDLILKQTSGAMQVGDPSGTFLCRRLKVKGVKPGQDVKVAAMATVLEAMQGRLQQENVWLTMRDMVDGGATPPVPCYPDLKHITLLHIFNAYTDALPREPFEVTDGESSVRQYSWCPPEHTAPPVTPGTDGLMHALAEVRFRLSRVWASCEQVKDMAMLFPIDQRGNKLREDLLVFAFSRVADAHNYDLVLDTVGDAGKLSIAHRLGWLNILNLERTDHRYDLDLRLHDHRRLAVILTDLAIQEPGPNFQDQKFSRHSDPEKHEFIPGWHLPDSWHADTRPQYTKQFGVPDDGHLLVRYCSDEAIGCKADLPLRAEHTRHNLLVGVPCPDGMGMYGSMDRAMVLAALKTQGDTDADAQPGHEAGLPEGGAAAVPSG